MSPDTEAERNYYNGCRFRGQVGGHYESYFQRANHPERPLAFWIRYTIFSPKGRPQDALGELWAIYFDGENEGVVAAKSITPIDNCHFAARGLEVSVGSALLNERSLYGSVLDTENELQWDLSFTTEQAPLLMLPKAYYERSLPKAKALVGSPNAVFSGALVINGESIQVSRWVGSQNHNWGSKHTDQYAWGQVAGFDKSPTSFFELATARIKLGPLWSPWLTLMTLRHENRDYPLNTLRQGLRARGSYRPFQWSFDSRSAGARIAGEIRAPSSAFVALPYRNPPGGTKTCLNSKLATCHITLYRPGHAAVDLRTQHRAAFEIITDTSEHGLPLLKVPRMPHS